MNQSNNNIIELKKVTKEYKSDNNTQIALENVSFVFEKGLKTSILGESGSGKTSMLNIIGGIDSEFEGELLFNGVPITDFDKYRREHVSFIFQDLNLITHHNLIKNITLGLTNDVVDKEKKALELLERVGLLEHAYKKPHQLSGGERQRVAVARALARETDVLLCDEPTGNLDEETKIEIIELITDVFKDRTIIFITHDEALAENYSDVILNIENKELIQVSHNKVTAKASDIVPNEKHSENKTFKNRFTINLLSKKLSLLNASYLVIIISAIFIFGTGIIQGVEKKIDEYLYDKYKVDIVSVLNMDYTINGINAFVDDFNKEYNDMIVGFSTGMEVTTTFVLKGQVQTNFFNNLQPSLQEIIERDIVYGRFPQNNNEILYSKGAAIQALYNFHSTSLSDEVEFYILFGWITGLSPEQLFNELNDIDISYKNYCIYTDKKAYDNDLMIVGIIDDIDYFPTLELSDDYRRRLRMYNFNQNSKLKIEYKGEIKEVEVNDNIYMMEEEFRNYILDVYVGYNDYKYRHISTFIKHEDLDYRKKVFDSLLLYKHMISGKDAITDERATYYDEVYGYKVAIFGGCFILAIFALISIYNGIKSRIDKNRINIGIYKSLGYSSKDIKTMFLTEGIIIALFITFSTLIGWFIINIIMNKYIANAVDPNNVFNLGRLIHLDIVSVIGVIFTIMFIIFISINRELKKVNIINLIRY